VVKSRYHPIFSFFLSKRTVEDIMKFSVGHQITENGELVALLENGAREVLRTGEISVRVTGTSR
jgi:hypothetical protein